MFLPSTKVADTRQADSELDPHPILGCPIFFFAPYSPQSPDVQLVTTPIGGRPKGTMSSNFFPSDQMCIVHFLSERVQV